METPTPKIQMLLFRLAVLSSDLHVNLTKLQNHFRPADDQTILLSKKKKMKEKKKYRSIQLKETIDVAIEPDEELY